MKNYQQVCKEILTLLEELEASLEAINLETENQNEEHAGRFYASDEAQKSSRLTANERRMRT